MCCVKMEDIGLYILCHRTEENPSVTMGTGTTPCSSCGGRGEAEEGTHEQMYYVICVFSVWKSHCEDKYVFRHISWCYRKRG